MLVIIIAFSHSIVVFRSFLEEYKKRALHERGIPKVIDITVADNAAFIRLEDIFKRFRWKRTPRNRRGGDDNNTEGGRRADDSATERRELLDFYASMINEYERRTNTACTAQVVAEIARRIRATVFCNLSNIYGGTAAASVLPVLSYEGKYVRS